MTDNYWSSLPVNSRNFEIAKMVNYISLGFLLSDFIATFSFDASIILGKRNRRMTHLAYIGAKFTWLTYMASNMIVLWTVKEINCQLLMNFIELQMGLLVCFSSFLLATRTVCVYQGTAQTIIGISLTIFGLGLVGSWMQGVPDVSCSWSSAVATPWNTGGCAFNSVKTTYWAKYVVTIAFDLLVLILTTVGIIRMDSKTRIGDILIKHGLIYFILTCAANLVVTTLAALQLSPVVSLFMAPPQSTVCVICSTRLYMSLAKQARPYNTTQVNSGSLHDAPFSASKFSSLVRRATGKSSSIIPFSPTKNDFSTGMIVISNGSQHTSSSEDLEKISNKVKPSTTMIRIDKTRIVQVDPILSSSPGRRQTLICQVPLVHESEETITEAHVAAQYPRLLKRSKSP